MADIANSQSKGAPVWLVTFADLMALLFALFVLILSFSDVDSDSFKRNAGPIAEAFNQPVPSFVKPVQIAPPSSIQLPQSTITPSSVSTNNDTYLREVARNKLINLVKSSISTELSEELIELVVKDDHIVMRFPAHSAFRAGEAELSIVILPAIDKIADILNRTDGEIIISGHTDNVPISTSQFRSNWDLSSARAVSVIHRLLRHPGLSPKRLIARGRADTEPLVPNTSAANQVINRRVEIMVKIPTSTTVH